MLANKRSSSTLTEFTMNLLVTTVLMMSIMLYWWWGMDVKQMVVNIG
nr:unnamed protein product [Callosobruchus chinensis]